MTDTSGRPHCGRENDKCAAFCDECGSRLETNNKKTSTAAITAAVAVIIIAVVVIIICLFALKGGKGIQDSEVSATQQSSSETLSSVRVPSTSQRTAAITSTSQSAASVITDAYDQPLKITASAITVLSDELGFNYAAANLVDGNTSTCWAEGADGSGIGETFVIKGSQPFYADSLTFYNGYCKSKELFYNNNRVKKIRIIPDNGESFIAEFSDRFEFRRNVVNCGHTLVNSIRFEILEVYKGEKWDDTCISEIYVNQP